MESKDNEIHPFEAFIPVNANYLLLGSFPCKNVEGDYGQWFYCGSGRNLFWSLLEDVYQTSLSTLEEKKQLLTQLGLATTDISKEIQRKSTDRKDFCNDANLEIKQYNTEVIKYIVDTRSIKKVFFTSKFVEKHFNERIACSIDTKKFQSVTLLSPSPNAARPYSKRADVIKFKMENPTKKVRDFVLAQYKSELPTL